MVLTKKITKRATLLKPEVRFYMAEEFRQEIGGKVSAVGLYTDNVVVLPIPADIPDPSESAPILFKSLGFLFNVSNFTQPALVSIEVEAGGERSYLFPPKEYPGAVPGSSINLISIMTPAKILSFGVKKLIVTVGTFVETFTFEIRRVPPQVNENASVSESIDSETS